MNKGDYVKLEEINQRSKSNTKRLDEHDKKIDKLENVYIALTKMDGRVEKVECDVSEIKTVVKEINPNKSKALKWDKLIDYIFYFILAIILGFIAIKLGLKG